MHFADMFANIYLVGKILYRQSFASKIKMTVLLINWKSKLKHCTVDIDKSGWAYRSVVAYLPSVCTAVDLVSRTEIGIPPQCTQQYRQYTCVST